MNTFERVVVISLARRAHRLADFMGRIGAAWPGVECRVFEALDGAEEGPPDGWKTTRGAWGCARSHAAVMAECAADGIGSVLVFEDDATFVRGFAARLAGLEVPADCEQLYLGGQHLARPDPVPGRTNLVRGTNVNRTHAYAVIGASVVQRLADYLRWDPATWTAKHHVDHHYGLLHRRGQINAYAVKPWLCGQAANVSDVDGRVRPARSWS